MTKMKIVKTVGKYSATKIEAVRGAKQLLRLMTSPGWEMRVWKNIGWHYGIHNSRMSVSPHYFGGVLRGYFALLSDWPDKIPVGGVAFWHSTTDKQTFKDPNKAVEMVLGNARAFRDRVNRSVILAENEIHPEYAKRSTTTKPRPSRHLGNNGR